MILSRNNIADIQNILLVSNFEKAEELIENQLWLGKRHIDLIIMADKIKNNFRNIHIVD
jgi:hypothetical protein